MLCLSPFWSLPTVSELPLGGGVFVVRLCPCTVVIAFGCNVSLFGCGQGSCCETLQWCRRIFPFCGAGVDMPGKATLLRTVPDPGFLSGFACAVAFESQIGFSVSAKGVRGNFSESFRGSVRRPRPLCAPADPRHPQSPSGYKRDRSHSLEVYFPLRALLTLRNPF